ncbi:MAG: hypothetical protein IKV16_01440 [Clostridia bacterium]|nr:hypothetical protein [Clostridia bacterium]
MEKKRFDLNIGNWGPYNKDFLGVCHIADRRLGASFNVELFPGFFRRKVMASYSTSDMGLKMWGANASLTHFSYRYELEWKDRVYCDTDFYITDDSRCDIVCTFVNNTELVQSVNMNLCASLQYPLNKDAKLRKSFRMPTQVTLPKGCRFVDALEYDYINCSETLASDGRYLGEEYVDGATGNCTAISDKYFCLNSHYVNYTLQKSDKKLLIRYIAAEETKLVFVVDKVEKTLSLKPSDNFVVAAIDLPDHGDGAVLKICNTGKGVTIDSLVFGVLAEDTVFTSVKANVEPNRVVAGNKMTLTYDGIPTVYTIEWNEPMQMVRRYYYDDIGQALTLRIHDHVSEILATSDAFCVYENLLSEPLYLEAGERRTLTFTVSSKDGVLPEKADVYKVKSNSDGERFAFSQNMMAANTFLNVVYPIYTRRQYIRHNTPGRQWDSLYSWDSGFIGMGLATADFDRGFDCLNTYLVPVGDIHSPYIFHGSVVPTQIYLYQYLFNKYPEKRDRLKELYPMVKQYFDFYANMDRKPGQMKSGLIKTWDIFYNSGGWDDYPPQLYMHNTNSEEDGTHNTTPVITSAVTVLIAKILRSISLEFGIDDIADYDRAIEKYSYAIQKHTWNDKTGYFSYLLHDKDGNPKEFLKYSDGTDFNCGFDGIYPYLAAITTDYQSSRIISNIKEGLFTKSGVGVVDKRAPYYRTDGYWNGSVWMPHQWELWKSLFDYGECDLAYKIADTALTLWQREVEETYCCFENFMSESGRGSGFHQFSGLSTPVLMFFESYYKPGTVTLGFLANSISEEWNKDKSYLRLAYKNSAKHAKALICMNESGDYSFSSLGRRLEAKKVTNGAYEVELSCGEGEIEVKKI